MNNSVFGTEMFLVKEESEKMVLGALFAEPELIDQCILSKEQFGHQRNQTIFQAITQLHKKKAPIDLGSVLEQVGVENIGVIGGISYLSEILQFGFSTSTFEYHQSLMLEYWKRRKIVEKAQTVIEQSLSGTSDDLLKIFADGQRTVEEYASQNDEMPHISDILQSAYENMTKDSGGVTGAETGFKKIDEMTSGFQRQDLVIIGARPSVGKTAFALNLATNYTEKGGVSAIFSIEMPGENMAKRMLSDIGTIDGTMMLNPMKSFKTDDWNRSAHAMAHLSGMNLYLEDKSSIDVGFIRRRLKNLKKKHPDEHIVAYIDYLQLIKGDPSSKVNRTQEISDISRELKNIARELDITVVALSQLSRKVEERADKRPMLSDLRDSGQIEQDADLIMLLYRDEYYDSDSEEKGIIEVNLAKHRNGPIGEVKLAYAKEYSKFVDLP